MILLDTNIVSEIYRPVPDPSIVGWIDSQPRASMYLCAPVLAELRFGMERLAESSRKDRLRESIDRLEGELYRNRILAFDAAAASAYGRMAPTCQRLGKPIGQMDLLIAAIASIHGAAVATRNFRDFDGLGLQLINPFESIANRRE
jgi:toxin FitB